MLRFQNGISKRSQKHFADKLVHQFASAAVREQDMRVLRDRNRTTGVHTFISQRMKRAN